MSQAVFPTFVGLTFDNTVAPQFNTKIHRAVSGYEVRAAYMVNPLWTFKMKYELLRDDVTNNELKTLLGFFNARQGSFDSFLYNYVADNAVTGAQFGIGTGTQTAFQLTRSYGGFIEPVMNLNGAPSIYINGALQTLTTNYTISASGMVTFVTAPATGAVLTWTGAFYYRCRFLADSIDPVQFMQNLYSLSKLGFIGSPMNKV